MLCENVLTQLYKREPDGVAFCPYRVCPLGAHSDHQFGKITVFAWPAESMTTAWGFFEKRK